MFRPVEDRRPRLSGQAGRLSSTGGLDMKRILPFLVIAALIGIRARAAGTLTIDTGVGRYVYQLEEGGTDEAAKSFWTRNATVEQHFAMNVELKSAWPIDEVRVPGADAEAKITKVAEGHYKVAIERQHGD